MNDTFIHNTISSNNFNCCNCFCCQRVESLNNAQTEMYNHSVCTFMQKRTVIIYFGTHSIVLCI